MRHFISASNKCVFIGKNPCVAYFLQYYLDRPNGSTRLRTQHSECQWVPTDGRRPVPVTFDRREGKTRLRPRH